MPMKNGAGSIPLSNKPADLITVIVLSCGPGDQYEQTLRSVLDQDYPRLELIVSDDGSETFRPDAVLEFIRSHCRQNICALEVRRNESNLGIPRHNNRAARLAHGAYIKFVADGDRFFAPDSLRRLWEFSQLHAEDVLASPSVVTNETHTRSLYQFPSGRRIRKLNQTSDLFSLLAEANILSAVGMLYRPAFFRNGGFDEGYRYLEDWPAWLKIAREGGRIPCLGTPTMRYALSGISSSCGSAFENPLLRKDLIRCYEREILPYCGRLSASAARRASYQLGLLQGERPGLREIPFELMRTGKKSVKKLFFR